MELRSRYGFEGFWQDAIKGSADNFRDDLFFYVFGEAGEALEFWDKNAGIVTKIILSFRSGFGYNTLSK